MSKKDEIMDLVAKLKDGRFNTFDDLARVVQNGTPGHTPSRQAVAFCWRIPLTHNTLRALSTAVRVQNEVGNIELIKMAHWPLDLLNSLKLVVGIVHAIRCGLQARLCCTALVRR
jgi:hypothetical protein